MGGGRGKIDRAAQGAGAVLKRIAAAGNRCETRGQRIDHAVVVVAVSGRDRHAVLQKLNAASGQNYWRPDSNRDW